MLLALGEWPGLVTERDHCRIWIFYSWEGGSWVMSTCEIPISDWDDACLPEDVSKIGNRKTIEI